MADYVPQEFAEGFNTPTWITAASGDKIVPASDRPVMLVVRNADASAKTPTVEAGPTPLNVPGVGLVTKANLSAAIPAGEFRFILISPISAYRDPTTQKIDLSWSATTSVTWACFYM